jgi:hypothetical protein
MQRELPPAAAIAIIVLVVAFVGLIYWRYAGTSDPAHMPRERVMEIWKKAGGAPPPGYTAPRPGGPQGGSAPQSPAQRPR